MGARLTQILTLAGAALVAAACTSAMVAPQHEKKPAGPAGQFGQGHFSKDAKAFHYWDKDRPFRRCARSATPRTASRRS